MSPYHEADGIRLFLGDAREVMRSLPAESVSCIMTSPPFWGLRSYSCEPSIWGGDPNCSHRLEAGAIEDESYAGRQRWQHDGVSRQETPEAWVKTVRPADKGHLNVGFNERWGNSPGVKAQEIACSSPAMEHASCSLCGCWRGQLGLEPSVGAYIEHTMEWLREAKRVLRKDGVCWVDLGDSRSQVGGQKTEASFVAAGTGLNANRAVEVKARKAPPGIPTKSLCLIPQRIAIACQDDGWIVRNYVIIKARMPESANDRMTRSYRVLLVLTKQQRYWWDGQAIKMPLAASSIERISQPTLDQQKGGFAQQGEPYQGSGNANQSMKMVRSLLDNDGLKNCDDLWLDIPPAAWPSGPGFEHFATFCVEEPERCIKASCPAEICVKCGKPRVRIVKKANVREHPQRQGRTRPCVADFDGKGYRQPEERGSGLGLTWDEQTIGWTDCGCNAGFEPGLCLDPFIGTGTTAVAARMLGRKCIGIDASEGYLRQAVTRLTVGDSGIRRMVAARRAGAEQAVML
jgi:DNA modification methylase